ncbi:AAA family ATPase [Acidianus brierleyi]|uniref:CobQ/CobB/MinD/ParA nucleotide binding domain-containing protein n=1 Tax=Acidianus brierleyi TaxID=41673 RepID=A0A2U9IGX0_9CREN|nr:AAA family ATPase [Acidianus brierleyi]AWR95240.1 AAA family ATPase [Acidianus brierleyi]
MRIVVLGAKGGVGKSTISLLLSKEYVLEGKKVLLIDRDPLSWASNLIGIKDPGLLYKVVNGEKIEGSCKTVLERLTVLKFFGDYGRFYYDIKKAEDPSLRQKLEDAYYSILKRNFDVYIVDNPSLVTFNDEIVEIERNMFRKALSDQKRFRIYVTDPSESSIEQTKKYIEGLEKGAYGSEGLWGLVVNMIPPFPQEMKNAEYAVADIENIKIFMPFIEELFMGQYRIESVKVPEEIKALAKAIQEKVLNYKK